MIIETVYGVSIALVFLGFFFAYKKARREL